MQHITRRLSPSLIVAIAALFAALGGTAVAQTGILIDSPDQIKDRVITGPKLAFKSVQGINVAPATIAGGNVVDRSIAPVDLRDPQLRVRVLSNDSSNSVTLLPGSNGSVTRVSEGRYHVTFATNLLNPGGGTRTISSENCAFSVVPRNKLAIMAVSGPLASAPNTVTVEAAFPDPAAPGLLTGSDTDFDITASC